VASRLTWIILALGFAIYSVMAKPLVLGLDLKGGVTMRYELDPPGGPTPTTSDLDGMIEGTVETLRNRINEYGIKESSINRQGEREIVIELPGSSKEEAESIKSVVARVGRLEFRIVLRDDGSDDDARANLVMADERKRLEELLAAEENKGRLADEVDVTSLDLRTPDVLYRWYPYSDRILARSRGTEPEQVDMAALLAEQPLRSSDFMMVRVEQAATRTFTGADILRAQQTLDSKSNPAVGIYMNPARAAEFGDWTEPNKDRAMGMLLDGRLAEHPATINDRLESYFIIQSGAMAGFSPREIKDYLTVIKSGSLQMKPRLLYENSVGPSLGEAAIDAGIQASIIGLIVTGLFMILYYRAHGVIATVCLALNLVLLTGLLMFLGATITLPGIAGLVLTMGMAVDCNILIFERMREESDRGKSPEQAVRLGFEKALSTIVDANVTSFVTAFVLYKVGSGPVRGFAVILMLGIVTSVFSVLVFGRVIYDMLLERGFKRMSMSRFLADGLSIPFMKRARVAMTISGLLVVAGLLAFGLADRDKYGLDFVGGYKAQVRLRDKATQGEITQALASDFPGAQVISVLAEGDTPEAGSQQFLIKVKAGVGDLVDDVDAEALEDRYERPLKQALSGRVLPDFASGLTLAEDSVAAHTAIACVLHFEQTADPALAPTPEKVAEHLAFLSDVQTAGAEDGGIAVSGTWARVGLDAQQVVQRLRQSLEGTADLPPPSEPFIESTTIGARVGSELRDSASRALLLSFLVTVIYLRIRFREYRYGIAAVIALIHDVCITLGVVALVHFSGFVQIEIDLAMIAAFLTIIGYSVNDTIVVFDRIRENLPRMPDKSLSEVIDISVNQTLSRTLLTSATVMLSLIIIFVFNYGRQNVLEGFSFAMIVGVIVGTYSSIYIASPILVLMERRRVGAGPGVALSGKPPAAREGRRPATGTSTTEGAPA